jgi:hypothetical protein
MKRGYHTGSAAKSKTKTGSQPSFGEANAPNRNAFNGG